MNKSNLYYKFTVKTGEDVKTDTLVYNVNYVKFLEDELIKMHNTRQVQVNETNTHRCPKCGNTQVFKDKGIIECLRCGEEWNINCL